MKGMSLWPSLFCLLAATAGASPLIYQPVNPEFGGNPLNGSWLGSNASSQNNFKDPNVQTQTQQTPIQQFNSQLENAILSRVANAVSGQIVDSNGNLKPGTVDTGQFRVTVTDNGDGTVTIVTVDKTTGETSRFDISQTNNTP